MTSSFERKYVELRSVADFINGYAFKSADFINSALTNKGDLQVFKMGNLVIGGGIRKGKEDYITSVVAKSITKEKTQKYDILMCMTDMKSSMKLLGYSGQIKDEVFVVNQRVGIVRPKTAIVNPVFLYCYMNSPEYIFHIRQSANSGVQVNLSSEAIKKSLILLPSKEIQDRIAKILSDLDQKIELNQKMNKTLEEMGQALFKHYFIENSDAKNWEKKPLDEVADFLNGLASQKYPAKKDAETLPVIKIREMSGGVNEGTDRVSVEFPKEYIIKNGDFLFAWSGTLMTKIWTEGEGALNQHIFKVTSKLYPKWFYYYWTNHYLRWFAAIAKSKAVTMGHIKRSHLSEAIVLIPPRKILNEIDGLFRLNLEKQIANSIEISRLSIIRDTLLPKLINGEIDV